ncbi:IniB N-terminal domain-containing protein [Pseudarthrobacter sp. YAF2]|uniref:IniB N-terminal domain-containing protein n=1 Tax=Pseudarthrobacter sp. YAF2 TaxID=3233078 RepID=UPI003F9DDDA9
MPTLANDLVQFLMQLFGDREAVQEFLDNPERALADNGLGNVCSADVDAAMPVVLDYAPITVNVSSFERNYNTGGNGSGAGPAGAADGHGGYGPGHGSTATDTDDHAYAVQQLHQVVNHFSYTAGATIVDERATIAGQSAQQNVWAQGDVEQWFDNDGAVAAGDHAAVAAGHAPAGIGDAGTGNAGTPDISMEDDHNGLAGSLTAIAGLDPDDSFAGELDHSGHSLDTGLVPAVGGPYGDPAGHDPVAVDLHMDDPFADNAAASLAGDAQLDFAEDSPAHPDADLETHHIIDVPVVDDSAGL